MISDEVNFEMANGDKPEEIIAATQRSIIGSMHNVIADLKTSIGGPGMTWEQIEFLLENFAKKVPQVLHQEGEM